MFGAECPTGASFHAVLEGGQGLGSRVLGRGEFQKDSARSCWGMPDMQA